MPLVARYANIWNANNLSATTFKDRSALLDDLLWLAPKSRPRNDKNKVERKATSMYMRCLLMMAAGFVAVRFAF